MTENRNQYKEDDGEIDFSPLLNDIVMDVSHALISAIDKSIENYYYSVEMDSTDNTITIIFNQPIYEQNKTTSLIENEIRSGISPYAKPNGVTIILLKPTEYKDVMAELRSFTIE